jgi:hypothetical protein
MYRYASFEPNIGLCIRGQYEEFAENTLKIIFICDNKTITLLFSVYI